MTARGLRISRWALVGALLTDLFSPALTQYAGWPEQARWLSHGLVAALMATSVLYLLQTRRLPIPLWLVLGFSAIGGTVALLNSQGAAATAWGWWLMFRYPLVGLYAYLEPAWPEDLPRRLRIWCIRLLCLEVTVQVGQYLLGETPGDSLAGTLGANGTGHLVLLVLWVLALALGDWVASGRIGSAALVVGLGVIASVLGEMKLFFPAAAAMAGLAAMIRLWRARRLSQTLAFAVLMAGGLFAFVKVYDAVIPGGRAGSYLGYFQPQQWERYMTAVWTSNGQYRAGRNYVPLYVWQRISSHPISLAFGEGLGARGESRTLGTAGIALLGGDLGLLTGNSLAVIMGELGVLGLAGLAGFMVAVLHRLWKATRTCMGAETGALLYALLLYSVLWPVWLWYSSAWTLPVPMLLYWLSLGYSASRLRRPRLPVEPITASGRATESGR